MSDKDIKCIGLSACGGPCDESCPVIRQKSSPDENLNACLADVKERDVVELTMKVSEIYTGTDLATAILSLHMLLQNYLEEAPPVMVKESHHVYSRTASFLTDKNKKRRKLQ